MKKTFLFVFAVLLLTGCASSERMLRLSPANTDTYNAPDSSRLNGKKVEKTAIAEENVVNLWPLYLKNDCFYSVLWPVFDYDEYGMAIRPFYNQEGNDHSILFPLCGWNTADKSGWALNTFWGKNRLAVFPLFAYGNTPDMTYVNVLLLLNYYNRTAESVLNTDTSRSYLFFPFFYGKKEFFSCTPGGVNYFLWKQLDDECVKLRKAFANSDIKAAGESRKIISDILKAMKVENDFELPSNANELKNFAADLQAHYGITDKSEIFSIIPFYSHTESMDISEKSWLFGLLKKEQTARYHNLNLMPPPWTNKTQLVETDYSRTLLLSGNSVDLIRKYYPEMSYPERYTYTKLHFMLHQLAVCLQQDEFNRSSGINGESQTGKYRKEVEKLADTLGITLPELETPLQCYIYRREIEGMCLDHYTEKSTSFMPFFEETESKYSNKFEIFPLIYNGSKKYTEYNSKDILNIIGLCHNQREKDRIPDEKIKEVFAELENLERLLGGQKISQPVKLKEALKNASLSFKVPVNFRECRELKDKLYEMIPENTETISFFLPLYFYKGNDVADNFYLNILGVLYNQYSDRDDYWFNVLGFIARGSKNADEENFSILEYLYRSSKKENEKDYFVFPFFYYHTTEDSSQFSFMHRIVNVEKTKNGTKGHIFYIPFGD